MLNPDTYDPQPLPREAVDKICPVCGCFGEPTNHYLYRCANSECGKYW